MSDTDTSKTNPNPEDVQQDNQEAKDTKGKTLTQEEFEKALSERLKREREKADKERAEALKKEREEWERQAKLSEEERKAEERKRMEQETAQKLRDITLRENRADAREILQEKNISTELVDFVVDVDADKTRENIINLESAFTKAVEAAVADRLKGQTPPDKSSTTNTAPADAPTVF